MVDYTHRYNYTKYFKLIKRKERKKGDGFIREHTIKNAVEVSYENVD